MRARVLIVLLLFQALLPAGCGEAERAEDSLREAVVLLPGLGRTTHSMEALEERLAREGYQVLRIDYPSREKTVSELSEVVGKTIGPLCEDEMIKVHFVTHSLGGVILRYYMAYHECPSAGRTVMLSPPNQGTVLVDKLGDSALFNMATGPAARQLGTGPDGITSGLGPVDFELGVITGNKSLNPIGSIMIPGEDYGIGAVESAKVDGMSDFLVVPATHSFIMRNPAVIEQALYFIQNGEFKREIRK